MPVSTSPDTLINILRDTIVALVRRDGADLSARQLAVLLTVYLTEGPHTVRGLAATLNVSKPAITRALDRLGALDLARRKTGSGRPSVCAGAAHGEGGRFPARNPHHHGRERGRAAPGSHHAAARQRRDRTARGQLRRAEPALAPRARHREAERCGRGVPVPRAAPGGCPRRLGHSARRTGRERTGPCAAMPCARHAPTERPIWRRAAGGAARAAVRPQAGCCGGGGITPPGRRPPRHPGLSVARREIYPIQQRRACAGTADVLDHLRRHTGGDRRARRMRRDDHLGMRPERAVGWQRFGLEHIQRGCRRDARHPSAASRSAATTCPPRAAFST